MSEPENFLSRWSRRKLDAEQEPNPSARPRESGDPGSHKETAEPAALDSRWRGNERGPGFDATGTPSGETPKEEPPFDISTLPSLESITAETDIRVFLQRGVPAELSRAALRRAWAADPNIRNFIGIAENQYDFATGSDLPGFGSLEASSDEIRRMVAEVFGEGFKPSEAEAKPGPETAETPSVAGETEAASSGTTPSAPPETAAVAKDQPPPESAAIEPAPSIVQRNEVNIASQQDNPDSEYQTLPIRRRGGGALPQ